LSISYLPVAAWTRRLAAERAIYEAIRRAFTVEVGVGRAVSPLAVRLPHAKLSA
jgi:hypothetical protein